MLKTCLPSAITHCDSKFRHRYRIVLCVVAAPKLKQKSYGGIVLAVALSNDFGRRLRRHQYGQDIRIQQEHHSKRGGSRAASRGGNSSSTPPSLAKRPWMRS